MNNDFQKICMETLEKAWESKKTEKGMQILIDAFLILTALGLTAAAVMLDIPYNLTDEIINKYKTDD